ncbi:MAG: ABC transporter ATP-binding protein [Actinomycetota bacterium]
MLTDERGAYLLAAENLVKEFSLKPGRLRDGDGPGVRAVDDVSFGIREGESLGLVGESGAGKSTLARLVMRLIPATSGRIIFAGRDITRLSRKALRPIRTQMQMVFQDSLASLNLRKTVGGIISAPLRVHGVRGDHRKIVGEVMERVGLSPDHRDRYPQDLSGGQRQRAGLARALILRPRLLVCDEPVSALDVSIRAQILNLLTDLQRDLHLGYLFIAHDLSVIRQICDRVAVMYMGKIVEIAERDDLYERPLHPYTRVLLSSVPIPDPKKEFARRRILLQGETPSLLNPPSGCRFRTRCWKAQQLCRDEEPRLEPRGGGPEHAAACHFVEDRS